MPLAGLRLPLQPMWHVQRERVFPLLSLSYESRVERHMQVSHSRELYVIFGAAQSTQTMVGKTIGKSDEQLTGMQPYRFVRRRVVRTRHCSPSRFACVCLRRSSASR